jgi:DNA-binding transcriptional LysR family regulator
MRPEAQTPDLAYMLVTQEPLVAVLPSDHRLAACDAIDPHGIVGETVVSVSNTAGSRGRQSRNGNVSDRLDAGRRALARLRTELHALVRDQPSDQGERAND